jgi:type III pantothenate kinase
MNDFPSFPFLLVDAGNSRIKMRYFYSSDDQEDLVAGIEKEHETELPVQWNPNQIVISASGDFPEFLSLRWPKASIIPFSPSTISEIDWAYEDPDTLGKDRAAQLLAAKRRFPNENLLVVSAGTCLTFDFLAPSGKHMGGFISPGLPMRLRSMHDFTHSLPLASVSDLQADGPGKNTRSCLAGGSVWGMVAEIDHHAQFHPFPGQPIRLVLTGGDAVFLGRFLKPTTFVAPDLIFDGLLAVLKELG